MRVYRKLLPTESHVFQDHLLRLGPGDRRARFSGSVSPEVVVAYCRRLNWVEGLVLGCFIDGELRAAGELKWDAVPLPRQAELAVTVEAPWQNQGIGTELLRRMLVLARNRSIKSVTMICMLDNHRMRAITRKLDGWLTFAADQVTGDIALPFPTQLSLLQEGLADGHALMASCLAQLARRLPDRPSAE